MRRKDFSQEEINKIIELYNNNYSQQKISDIFQVSRPVIKRVLTENNVQQRERTHKHKGDYSIFNVIDTAEKAYWLGFLAADGCNYQRENNATIFINIHQKDRELLEKFLLFCEADNEIIDYIADDGFSNNTPMCKVSIYSKEMSQALENAGVPPKKSLILKPPMIEEKFFLPYICGYFDGDGSISKSNQYNNYNISIQGTKELLEWINSILNISNHLEKRKQDNQNSYYIRCGGTNKPYSILKQLYNSCDTHLNRKFNLYKDLETVVLNRNVQ